MRYISGMATTHPTTRISSGEIIGRSEGGIDRYLGIPFAAPPFAAHRFALPLPRESWAEARECVAFGPTSPQTPYPGRIGRILGSVDIPGENVLTANVWAPSGAEGLPVVLWLHGGAFERGASAIELYEGTSFARDGVVFVSANYRLGSEGFSVLDGAPRNLGLEDAAAALRWTHAEVAAFGGDPKRITVMGESAGGSLVAALLSRPERELIAGAIVQSGPLSAQPLERAARVTKILAKKLGVPATREAFAKIDPKELLRVRSEQMAGKTLLDGVPSFALALDPASLPMEPADGVREAKPPLLIGFNSEEYRLWFAPEALAKTSAFKLWLVTKVLKISKRAVAECRQAWPGASHGEILGQLLTDQIFRAPAVKAARERDASTYVYEFAWRTKKHELGATHALELGFVFDGLEKESAKRMADDGPQTLADQMHADWVEFIKTGRAPWPEYAQAGQTRIYDTEVTQAEVPRLGVIDALL